MNLLKKVLFIIFIIIILILGFKMLENDTQKGIDYCVSQGNSLEYCEYEIMRYE